MSYTLILKKTNEKKLYDTNYVTYHKEEKLLAKLKERNCIQKEAPYKIHSAYFSKSKDYINVLKGSNRDIKTGEFYLAARQAVCDGQIIPLLAFADIMFAFPKRYSNELEKLNLIMQLYNEVEEATTKLAEKEIATKAKSLDSKKINSLNGTHYLCCFISLMFIASIYAYYKCVSNSLPYCLPNQ